MNNRLGPKASPSISRLLLPVIGVLVLAVVGAAVISRLRPGGDRTQTANGPRLAVEPEGAVLNASVVIQDKTLEFVKAFRSPDFLLDHAPEGMEFVVVQFKPLTSNAGSLLEAAKAFRLTAGNTEYGITSVNLPTAGEVRGNGYVSFVIPKESGPDFILHPSASDTVSFTLPATP
jgi:hypothetical protein